MGFEKMLVKYAGKRVLVTGVAGCIGSNLVGALLKANVEKIVVLDDFYLRHVGKSEKSFSEKS